MNNNIRTMQFIGTDDWDRPVYKCIETGILYKDITLGSEEPELYSCDNSFDGEPDCHINSDLEIHFNTIGKQVTKEQKFNYQMLDRLKSDCEYFLGFGNRCKEHLYYHDEQKHIDKMKELYNSFSNDEKPEWLTYEQILKYEEAMIRQHV
jgi:hypothetical protein